MVHKSTTETAAEMEAIFAKWNLETQKSVSIIHDPNIEKHQNDVKIVFILMYKNVQLFLLIKRSIVFSKVKVKYDALDIRLVFLSL